MATRPTLAYGRFCPGPINSGNHQGLAAPQLSLATSLGSSFGFGFVYPDGESLASYRFGVFGRPHARTQRKDSSDCKGGNADASTGNRQLPMTRQVQPAVDPPAEAFKSACVKFAVSFCLRQNANSSYNPM